MGALIQTKGTQRLAKWFNDVFDDTGTGIKFARKVKNSVDAGAVTLPSIVQKRCK